MTEQREIAQDLKCLPICLITSRAEILSKSRSDFPTYNLEYFEKL